MERVDEAVLDALRELLTPDLVDGIVSRLRALVAGEDEGRQLADDLARDLAAAELEVARYVEAIAITGDVPSVAQRLRVAEGTAPGARKRARNARPKASPAGDRLAIDRARGAGAPTGVAAAARAAA